MTSVNGVGSDTSALAVRIAEQNRLSVKTPKTAEGNNELASKLNALYGSDSRNKATTGVADVASLLGVNKETLTEELQGPNSAKVKELMRQAALLKAFQGMDGSASGNVFNTTA